MMGRLDSSTTQMQLKACSQDSMPHNIFFWGGGGNKAVYYNVKYTCSCS